MCSSISEFGFKIPLLARSDGEVVDGTYGIKAARKPRITEVLVITCDEWGVMVPLIEGAGVQRRPSSPSDCSVCRPVPAPTFTALTILWDGGTPSRQTGLSIRDQMLAAGCRVRVMPQLEVEHGIQAARLVYLPGVKEPLGRQGLQRLVAP
jgi:hypothetical protein